jgi:urea transport system substrate-binding protein
MASGEQASYWQRQISRRGVLRAGAGIGFVGAAGALGLACGSSKKDSSPSSSSSSSSGGGTIKAGILHSLSGTLSISEVSVKDSELLAIEEVNAAGGVLGKKIEPIVEDGASDWPTFAEKAKKLLQSDMVATVFGCWTSASRKAVLPVFEGLKGLLWYPVQYEGLESSPNIYYMGATTNQQIVPSVEYLLKDGKTKMFLLGSDYVFPRTANRIIKAQLAASGGTTVAEEYTPLGYTDYNTVISKIRAAKPDVVYNTLNGDSNVAFFKQLKAAGFSATDLPTLSVSIAEEEVRGIGADIMKDHLVAWNYYQTTKTPENEKFVAAYKAKYGANRVTDDPIEAGYIGVKLWAMAANKAGSIDVDKVRAAAGGLEYQAPEGKVKINPQNQHISKTVRIGKINASGLNDEIFATPSPVEPDPYLETYSWGGEFAKEKKK